MTLFYPGQSSYEWLRTSDHPGSKLVLDGQACTTCHTGMEKTLGDKLVKGGPLEPMPVKGKNGTVDLKFQAAYDAKNAYLRFQWKTLNPYPGSEHQYLRFDGKEWKVYGYPKLDKVVQDGKQPGIYEDRMTIMIDDGKVPQFAQQGCWLTCHDGQRDMPKQFTKEEVNANALLTAIKKSDVRKYLPATRNDPSDWKTGKSVEEIAKIKAAGGFVDLIQWRAHRSHAVGMADDGYVLELRIRRCRQGHVRRQRRREDARAEVHVGREEGRLQVDHRRPAAQGRPFPDPRAERRAVRPECGLERRRHDPRLPDQPPGCRGFGRRQ